MIAGFLHWLDHRTGYRKLLSALLLEHIPGGAKWRYVWGSALAFVFLIQLITGVLLMTAYSPSTASAWGSVHYIQYEMDFGWLIRGLHHYGSQTMVVLLGVHMLQVVIAGAHLPPREVNWWLGLLLLGVVLAMSLTGYLLPWDQKGYFATRVATNIAGSVPGIGADLQKFIVGGPEYGNHTLTRFYALHVGILPALAILVLILHVAVFRRHGVTHSPRAQGEGWFWPDQAFRDLLVGVLIFGVMLGLVIFAGQGNRIDASSEGPAARLYEQAAHAGRDGRGAHLDAPADPATANYPARPEWYFLFLFQLLKYFPGEQETMGTVIIPGAATLVLFILPLLGYGRLRKLGHAAGVLVVVFLLASVGALTYLALKADADNPDFQRDAADAQRLARRAVQIAHDDGIPADGAQRLLARDPYTQGPLLFKAYCASCHSHSSQRPEFHIIAEKPTASDLGGFGSEKWIRGLLEKPDDPKYFGLMQRSDGRRFNNMAKWVNGMRSDERVDQQQLSRDFDQAARWLAAHPRRPPPDDDPQKADDEQKDQSDFARGYRVYKRLCWDCHSYRGDVGRVGGGPDFTGYGDAEWLRLMLHAPNHPLRYGRFNAMPHFRDFESPGSELLRADWERIKNELLEAAQQGDEKRDQERMAAVRKAMSHVQISDLERELIIRWLAGDYRLVFGGEPLAWGRKGKE